MGRVDQVGGGGRDRVSPVRAGLVRVPWGRVDQVAATATHRVSGRRAREVGRWAQDPGRMRHDREDLTHPDENPPPFAQLASGLDCPSLGPDRSVVGHLGRRRSQGGIANATCRRARGTASRPTAWAPFAIRCARRPVDQLIAVVALAADRDRAPECRPAVRVPVRPAAEGRAPNSADCRRREIARGRRARS